MGLSSIFRKFTEKKQVSPSSYGQGSAHSHGEEPAFKLKEPSQVVSSSHGGGHDPHRTKTKTLVDSHGGDYDPNRSKEISSDRRIEHGGNYDPHRTADNS